MTAEETRYFRMVDAYARNHHKCFLAEMFLNTAGTHYSLCFRPVDGNKESPNRYACRYLQIGADEVRTAGQKQMLGSGTTELLDRELSTLLQW